MKILASVLILSATYVGAAQAGELDYPPALNTASTLTRAQVQQELADARARGELSRGEDGYPATVFASASDKSRAQVERELAAARAEGLTKGGELDYPPAHG